MIIGINILKIYDKDHLSCSLAVAQKILLAFKKMRLKKYILSITLGCTLLGAFGLIAYRYSDPTPHQQMIQLLQKLAIRNQSPANPFNPEKKVAHCDSMLKIKGEEKNIYTLAMEAPMLLRVGEEQKAVNVYEDLLNRSNFDDVSNMLPDMAIAYMRLGERSNCMLNHNKSSCVFPIKDGGVHRIKTGSSKAIGVYKTILKSDPNDLVSRWLLNIAYMTLGTYPKSVPKEYLIPNLDTDTGYKVKPFTDMAPDLGLDRFGRAGGVIVDDFNNDGYLDIVTSAWDLTDQMHYYQKTSKYFVKSVIFFMCKTYFLLHN